MSGAGALCNLGLINQLHLDNATHAQDWCTRNPNHDTRKTVPGFWFLVSGRTTTPETRNLGPETRNQKPGTVCTRSPIPETLSSKTKMLNRNSNPEAAYSSVQVHT